MYAVLSDPAVEAAVRSAMDRIEETMRRAAVGRLRAQADGAEREAAGGLMEERQELSLLDKLRAAAEAERRRRPLNRQERRDRVYGRGAQGRRQQHVGRVNGKWAVMKREEHELRRARRQRLLADRPAQLGQRINPERLKLLGLDPAQVVAIAEVRQAGRARRRAA